MRRTIATVSLSGMRRERLQAIAAAYFDGVEIFENDLLQFSGKPREVRVIAADLGLAIDVFQPFRDFDGTTMAQVRHGLERAEHKFDLMEELGTDLILVCSSVQPDALADVGVLAEQFQMLACGPLQDWRQAFESDFVFDDRAGQGALPGRSARVGHVVQAVPAGQIDPWVLFERAAHDIP